MKAHPASLAGAVDFGQTLWIAVASWASSARSPSRYLGYSQNLLFA